MGYIYIDSNQLLIFIIVPAMAAFVAGFGFLYTSMGRAAKEMWAVKRKKSPVLLSIGGDRVMRILPIRRGATGMWHAKAIELIPDQDATLNFYGTTAAISHSHSPVALNPEYLWFVNKTVSGLKARGAKDAIRAADIVESIKVEEAALKEKLELINGIADGKQTLGEYVHDKALRQGLTDEQERALRDELESFIADNGKEKVENQLAFIQKAKEITVERKPWNIVPRMDPTGKVVGGDLVCDEILKVDDFESFLPSGATLDDLWTFTKRSESAAIKESDFTPNQGMKWLSFGVVAFLIIIGVGYVLHLV